jgi:hypothetical protein
MYRSILATKWDWLEVYRAWFFDFFGLGTPSQERHMLNLNPLFKVFGHRVFRIAFSYTLSSCIWLGKNLPIHSVWMFLKSSLTSHQLNFHLSVMQAVFFWCAMFFRKMIFLRANLTWFVGLQENSSWQVGSAWGYSNPLLCKIMDQDRTRFGGFFTGSWPHCDAFCAWLTCRFWGLNLMELQWGTNGTRYCTGDSCCCEECLRSTESE